MKQLFFINSIKKSYGVKSISGYKKLYLLKSFEKSLIERNIYTSLYFGFEILCSGYYNDLWTIIFLFYIEYIHILNPELPFLLITKYEYFKKIEKKLKQRKINKLKLANLFNIQKDLIFIIKNIINTKNKHISFFIKQHYNNQSAYLNLEKRYILVIFKRFKLLLNKLVNNKITFTQTSIDILNEFFDVFGKLMVIDCDNPHIVDYPFHINIYHHHKDNKDFLSISNIFWNTILKSAKFNQNIFKQIGCIYKIFDSKLIQKIHKESYIYICVSLFFIYKLNNIPTITNTRDDLLMIKSFYENIQLSINNKTRRLDFIEIQNINEKKNKNKKSKRKPITKYKDTVVKPQKTNIPQVKVNTNDILLKMKPINYIITDSTSKQIVNTNVNQVLQKIEKNEKKIIKNNNSNDISFDINIHKYNDDNKSNEIEIKFNNNNNQDKYQLFKNFIDDFNILPTKNNQVFDDDDDDNNNSIPDKNINIPKKIYQKSLLAKPFDNITKLN